MLARHHHDQVPLKKGNASVYADRFVVKFTEYLKRLGISLPVGTSPEGIDPPTAIEVIGEHTYAAKSEYDRLKAKNRWGHFERKEWSDAVVLPDCVMRAVFQRLRQQGVVVTAPVAEFDATGAHRCRQGAIVIVV